ncbi:hypothetical protein DSO57_1032492 [Entomophthora muscae]|uniref:Uncharacterized protein n=1 Tax=Entomophthora muscae TaxID=34485 RepID=A0ACC2UL75_9FUNG|nr:hypothetical protein DSO57_1032492 [Entomophthora muscae]
MTYHHLTRIASCNHLKFKLNQGLAFGLPLKGYISLHKFSKDRFFHTTPASLKSPLPEKYQLIYAGPLAKTAKYLKVFSISSLVATFSLTPLIFVIDSGLSSTARLILFIASIATSSTSTALIHWCIHPYVTRAWVNSETLKDDKYSQNILGQSEPNKIVEKDTEFCFESLNLLGKLGYNHTRAGELKPSSRLFTSHKFSPAAGLPVVGSKSSHITPQPFYYLQTDLAERNAVANQLLNLTTGKLDALRANNSFKQN